MGCSDHQRDGDVLIDFLPYDLTMMERHSDCSSAVAERVTGGAWPRLYSRADQVNYRPVGHVFSDVERYCHVSGD